MGLEAYVPTKRDLILLYGAPGRGKTRLATGLPERFGDILYFALDEGSEGLDSVLDRYRGRITVIKPQMHNPLVDAGEISTTDWKAKFPKVKTIVIDTFSNLSQRVLSFITEKGLAQANHKSIGVPGTPSYMALSDKGDYGAAHGVIRNFITQIIEQQKDLNIIVICHEELTTDAVSGAVLGGPTTVGRKMLEWVPTRFKSVIRITTRPVNIIDKGVLTQKTQYVAMTTPHEHWTARINENNDKGNPIPQVVLNVDAINFWTEYDRNFYKEEVNA